MISRPPSKRPVRIAYGRIFHEANSFSPLRTEREAFESFHFYKGAQLDQLIRSQDLELAPALRRAELKGLLDAAEAEGAVECVPLISALAVPNGPLTAECFEWLKSELLSALNDVGQVDGVYLALHGSMRVDGTASAPEGILISAVRDIIGDKPLAVSYDLHGNMCSATMDVADIVEGYRTNPHRDLFRTGRRAGKQLIRTLRGQLEPTRAWRKLPMLLGGGTTIDFLEPMRAIFLEIKRWTMTRKAVSANVFMVHPYTNAPDLGWAVQVTTDGDQARAERLADRLAAKVWNVRKAELPAMRNPAQAIDDIRKSPISRTTGHLSLIDIGDVIGAGSTGGSTHLLEALVDYGSDLSVFVPLHDPRAVAELWSHQVGNKVEAVLRGTEGLAEQPIVVVDTLIEHRRHTGFGRTILLSHQELRIAITEKPPGAIHPRFWTELGLSPWQADAVVQKFFFHYRMFFAASGRRNIPVVSAGPTNLDNIKARDYPLPVWPKDDVVSWQSFDDHHRTPRP